MLVSFLLKRTSTDLNSKGFHHNMFLMMWATQKEFKKRVKKSQRESKRATQKEFENKNLLNANNVENKQDCRNDL